MELSIKDLGSIFQVSEETVFQWIRSRNLPACRVNRQYRVNRAELLEWANASGMKIPPELVRGTDPSGSPLPRLDEALAAGGVHRGIQGRVKDSVLKAVVDTLNLPPEVDREFLLQVLLAREAMGSTGIGDGIAIPHVRDPIILHVPRPMAALCFLEKSIDFQSLDSRNVHTLFLLLSPTVPAHLHLLSKVSYALRDPGFKAAITRRASVEELLAEAGRVEETLLARSPHPPA